MQPRKIPFLNLPRLFAEHRGEFMEAILGIAEAAHFIGGDSVLNFEKEFATWVGSDYRAVGCGNGTDAITLATKAFELPEGSEAILPAMTFIATAEGIVNAGVKIRLVDVADGTWLIDPRAVERSLSSMVRLLVPVHLYGQMAPMDDIQAIADRGHCRILEDSAQAHGAKWKDKPVGYWGDAATYSFFPGKNLGAFGDAGAVVSRSQEYIRKCSAWGKHGGLKKYEHLFPACNSRLDALQAAVLRVKLKYIDSWNEQRRKIAKWYGELLGGLDLVLPREAPDATHVYHLYVVLAPDRQKLADHLTKCQVETGVHYPLAIHQLPAFKGMPFASESFPNAEKLARFGLSLPMCPTLTEQDIEYVARSVRSFFGK